MTNIPTDLLRTLVAVVDLRSFTKASVLLGLTQPAVSAQIKRLQYLLGADLFDRSVQGISLTPQGEIVVSYARRLLSINDQIVHLGASDARPEMVIRVGTSSDYCHLASARHLGPVPRALARTCVSSCAPLPTIRSCAICAAAASMWSSACRLIRRPTRIR